MRSRRLSFLVGVIGLLSIVAIACTTDAPDATRVPTPEFQPTAAGDAAPPPTQSPAAKATTAPAGDAANGESVFTGNGCSACHSTGDNRLVGPGLKGVFARASSRVPGESADDYIMSSIKDPSAFVVDGFPDNVMPKTFASLPESDILDLVAYLKTLN